MTPQNRINEIQAIYKEWQDLHTRLETACQELKESQVLIKQMEQFYFDGHWIEIYEQIENGLKVDLITSGEYSVMSEDTLWNAFHEQQVLLWDFLRTATKALDKDNPSFYAQDTDNQTGNQAQKN